MPLIVIISASMMFRRVVLRLPQTRQTADCRICGASFRAAKKAMSRVDATPEPIRRPAPCPWVLATARGIPATAPARLRRNVAAEMPMVSWVWYASIRVILMRFGACESSWSVMV